MERKEFETLVRQAILEIPERIRERIKNVAFLIEDRASKAGKGPGARTRGGALLGLYEGVPLTERGIETTGMTPDRITLFQKEIEDEAGSADEIPRVVRETVRHEIAHYFGFGEKGARRIERKRRSGGK